MGSGIVRLWENRRCQRSNLNAVAEAAGKTTALLHAWAIPLGLTLPAGGIRSVDGHDYRAGNVIVS